MIIETEWKRFKRTCLAGKPKDEVQAARDIFYCGAAAVMHGIVQMAAKNGIRHEYTIRRIDALRKEMLLYQQMAEGRAKK